jgi:hypothetical protein
MQPGTTRRGKWTKRDKIIAVSAALMVALVSSMFVYLFLQAHRSNEAFSAFGDALVAKDYVRAYALTSSEFHLAMTEGAFAGQQTTLSTNLGALDEVKRAGFDTHTEGHGWTSDITARFIFKNGERVFDFKMKREGTGWKVFGYKER